MRNAKQLAQSLQNWPKDKKLDIYISGRENNPPEPLLLEALANHPGCGHLYYVPIDGKCQSNESLMIDHAIRKVDLEKDQRRLFSFAPISDDEEASQADIHKAFLQTSKPVTVLAYDLTELLKRKPDIWLTGLGIDLAMQDYIQQHDPIPVHTTGADFYHGGHGECWFDFCPSNFKNVVSMNHPISAYEADHKVNLPAMAQFIEKKTGKKVVAPCAATNSVKEVEQFMQEHHFPQIVLKQSNLCAGAGIYRVYRDHGQLMAECPDKDFEPNDVFPSRICPLTDAMFGEHGLLAMKWLDNSKGDIRAVLMNGKCVGAYLRPKSDDSWLCNYHQSGKKTQDVTLSRRERETLNAIAKTLHKDLRLSYVSVDLLADEKGERYLSEINLGCTDDLVEIDKHENIRNPRSDRLPVADRVAGEMMGMTLKWHRALAAEERALAKIDGKHAAAVLDQAATAGEHKR